MIYYLDENHIHTRPVYIDEQQSPKETAKWHFNEHLCIKD